MSISATHNIQSHIGQLRQKHKKFLNSKTAQPPHKPVQIYFIKIFSWSHDLYTTKFDSKKLGQPQMTLDCQVFYSSDDQMHLVYVVKRSQVKPKGFWHGDAAKKKW